MGWCPPLFDDSAKAVMRRLFLYTSDEVAALLREKYRVTEYLTDDYEYMAHMAWMIGGSSAAQSLVRTIDKVSEAWGKGDEEKALALTKVLTLHMISAWFRSIDRQPQLSADVRKANRETGASSMLRLMNKCLCARDLYAANKTAQDVNDFMNMDVQWNWENDRQVQPLTYSALLLARAIEACGQRCIDWGRVTFPVESVQQLLDRGAILDHRLFDDHQRVLPVVLDCVDGGYRAMRRFYQLNIERILQP